MLVLEPNACRAPPSLPAAGLPAAGLPAAGLPGVLLPLANPHNKSFADLTPPINPQNVGIQWLGLGLGLGSGITDFG